MTAHDAIANAEALLPGSAAPGDGPDPRWQAIIAVGQFIATNPEAVWEFVHRWGSSADEDLRTAIATCLLEHLLAHDFALIFPRVESAARANPAFADTFSRCWKSGQSELPANSAKWDRLRLQLQTLRPR